MPRNNHAAALPLWRKGQQLHRVYINQVVEHANAMGTIIGGPGICVTRTAGAVAIALAQPATINSTADVFVAKITASSSGAHAWTQLQPAAGGSFINHPSGKSGTTSLDPAYEINGRTSVPANTIVWLKAVISSDGSTKYLFDLNAGVNGSATNMAYSGEHADAASTTSWDINNQTSTRGVNLTVQTGQRYDHTADTPHLYAYLRQLSFDANGQLVAISAESRVIIDTPEACE